MPTRDDTEPSAAERARILAARRHRLFAADEFEPDPMPEPTFFAPGEKPTPEHDAAGKPTEHGV